MFEVIIGLIVFIAIVFALGFGGYILARYLLRNRDPENLPSFSLPDFRRHMPTRLAVVTMMAAVLLIPLAMIEDVVGERHRNYQTVLNGISKQWGKEQVLTGPVLVVPYQYRYQETKNVLNKEGFYQNISEWHVSNHKALILPDQLDIKGNIEPEYRQRSIYKSLVYRMRTNITGQFVNVEERIRKMTDAGKLHEISWDKAYLSIGLSDPGGIEDAPNPVFGDKPVRFSPGAGLSGQLSKGLHIPLTLTDSKLLPFDLSLTLKGSHGFRVTPVAEHTTVKLDSSWEHPGFYGDILPKDHTITAGQGFSANWSVSRLVRSYPQQWIFNADNHQLNELSFGVKLFEPVTLYTETTRAVKYGILFIGLTFITLLLIEWVAGVRPGFVQYFMIGASLSLFYLLLIATAEHAGFILAYVLSSLLVIGMIGLYSLSVLKRRSLAGLISTVLLTLYAVLYLILQSEDYALLSGTLLITVTLAASMYFTRNLDSNISQAAIVEA